MMRVPDLLPGVLFALLASAGCVDNPPLWTPTSATDMGDMGTDLGEDAGEPDAARTDADASDAAIEMGESLVADPGPPVAADVGDLVFLDGSGSTGAVRYQWNFGDGTGWDEPQGTPVATTNYGEPGRYQAVLTAFDEEGNRASASTVVTITHPPIFEPRRSTTVTTFGERPNVAVVSPDSNELMVASRDGFGFDVETRFATDRNPRTVALHEDWLVVPCQQDGTVLFFRTTLTGESRRVFLPYASRPFGAVSANGSVYVTEQSRGRVAQIDFQNGIPKVTKTADVLEDARHIATLPDGRLLVSRWRSADDGGEVAIVSADLEEVEIIELAVDPQQASDTEIGGLPSYLGPVAVSPTGRLAAVPSLQANIDHGQYLNGQPLTHEHTVRAVTSFIDLATFAEDFERRKQWDDRGFANDAVFTARGDFLWVAMRGNRLVERYDVLASNESGTLLEVGQTIEGIAVSDDDRWLFVDAYLSRELVIYDVGDLGAVTEPEERLQIPTDEPLDAELLLGKQLFNDAQDPRLTKDGYIACAHCHLDGESDRRVWDFTDRGEGLRNTISLVGRSGIGHGPLHWSANFDEVQDFEHDIRGPFAGTGLMSDAAFEAGARDEPLGDPKTGVSDDLDALAAYVTSFDAFFPSPYRTEAGELTTEAQAGAVVFDEAGCDDCHSGTNFTDSAFDDDGVPILHDVGTLTAASGSRLGGTLDGIDTPTLRGVWNSPPYLHDGSAGTVRDVLTTSNMADSHGVTSTLSTGQLDNLEIYLLSLDHR